VGGHVHRFAVGQHPDLSAFRVVVLTLLAFDGALSAVGGALFLPSYIGAIPFPVSALASGLINAALVWAASAWSSRPLLTGLPVWTWLLTVFVMAWPGPGGDVVLGGRGIMGYDPFLLLAAGAVLPFWVLWRRRTAH
jgi:hypothetical protein